MTIMNTTSKIIKDITNWSINTNNQIKEKLQKNKSNNNNNNNTQKTINKNKKHEKIEVKSNNNNNTIKQSFRSKTPLRTKASKPLIRDETKALTVNRNYIKSNKYFTINTKSEKLLDTKQKSNSFYIKKKKRKSINNNLNIETNNSLFFSISFNLFSFSFIFNSIKYFKLILNITYFNKIFIHLIF